MAYPTGGQYARWKTRASALDMSVSEFMQAMIEAGIKADAGFEAAAAIDETNREIRDQRDELKAELDRTRARVERLETQLYYGERRTIERYVEAHPGTPFESIVQHVVETVPQRVSEHLDELTGDRLEYDGDRYYPSTDDE